MVKYHPDNRQWPKRGCRWIFVWSATVFILSAVAKGQSPGDFSITYGTNYSSADRKQTVQPGFIGPASILYRANCRFMFGLDDDTFISNKTTSGYDSGTGDVGLEGHVTLWRGGLGLHDKCVESTRTSLRFDDILTVPVSGTLESTEVVDQLKLTLLRPFLNPLAQQLAILTVSGGSNVSGVSSGGTTANGVASANYYRNFHPDGAWAYEGEVDFASADKLGPSSVVALVAIDGALNKSQTWLIRFGTSFGVTPYAPKVSPFVQITFSTNLAPKPKKGGGPVAMLSSMPMMRRMR
ncbi:MAG: hypothetical protein WCD43_01490 [Candidatus Acidiferrales bacterium]